MNENALKPNTTLRGKAYTYTIQKVLGQGTFGITYLATTQVKVTGALGELETTMQVAIKEFFMKEMNGREENSVRNQRKQRRRLRQVQAEIRPRSGEPEQAASPEHRQSAGILRGEQHRLLRHGIHGGRKSG